MATNPDALFSDLVPPASRAGFSGYIPGVPKPKEPKTPVFVPKDATQIYDPNTGTYSPVPKAPGQADEEKKQLQDAIQGMGLDELLTNIGRARDNLKSPWSTGWTGAIAELKPGGGTPRDNFLGNLTSVKGAVIQEKLQALKDASKTGASGFGSLSEKEGELLSSALASLSPNMSQDEYEKSFRQIAVHAGTLQAIRDGKDPNSPAVQAAIQAQADKVALVSPPGAVKPPPKAPGGDTPPGLDSLTDTQKAKYNDFLATNPTAPQLKTFLEGMLPGQQVTNAEDILAAYKKGRGVSSVVDRSAAIKQRIQAENKLGIGEGPIAALGNQGLTLGLSDEAAGVGNALAGVVTGNLDVAGNYATGRDVERERIADARQQLGYGGTAIELGAGLLSTGPGALAALAPKEVVKAGAAGGALAGFGYGEGAGGSTAGALGGAAAGAAVAKAAPWAIGRVLPRGMRPSPALAPDVAKAADAEGVDLIRPMVDPASRTEFSGLEGKAFSQPIIRGAVDRTRTQMADATARLGGGGTPIEEPGTAGELLQNAGRRFIQRSRNVANRLYDRARSLAGDARFEPTTAIAQVDNEIAQLQSNPETNAGEINFLQGLKNDLSTPGGKTVEELRQLRTSLRGRISEQSLGATQAEARAMRAMDATQQDVAANAPAAASAYRRADSYYRERQTHIDDIIERITGGKTGDNNFQVSGEAAFKRIKSMASPGGDGRRLAALMRDLEPSERQDIAATIAQSLGRRSPDEPFSADRFITMTNQLSPSARRTIFGPDGAQSIQNLRRLSQALKDAGQDYNQSKSAVLLERAGFRKAAYSIVAGLSGLGGGAGALGGEAVGGTVAGAAVGAAALGATAIRRQLSARAMVNPRVSRWLADSVNVSTAKQAAEATRRLGVIIAREPALAKELQPIYDTLTARVNQPLAAQPEGDNNAQQQ